jgi:hypothetical protein
MAINRTTVSKKQTVDKVGKPAKNYYNKKFTDLEKSFNSWLEGVRVGRTEKHHRIVLKYLEPYLAKMSKKQALEVMKVVAQKTNFAYGDAKGNLVNLARELHTKDINAVHNLLQRYTSLQGIKQRSEFLAESLEKIKWRGEEVEVGNLVVSDTKGNYGIDPRRRIVGGQSDASIEFIDFFSKQKDVNAQADLLIGLLEDARPTFDGAIAAAVYLSDNPKIALEHKKRVLRQLGPKAQVWMEDFIKTVETDSAKSLLEASRRLDAHQLDKNYYKGLEVTRANDLATLKQNEKLADLVEGFKNLKEVEGLPFKEATAAADAAKYADGLSTAVKFKAGLKPWLAVPVLGFGASAIGTGIQAAETIRNPTAENKARLGVNVLETSGELASGIGWLTLNPALVAGGEAVATPTGLVDLGWTGKDLELHKWQTWRRLGVGVKDWAVDKATDDKGISSLWHNDNESREETAEIPEQSTTVLDQGESAEDTEEELEMGVSNFN